MKRLWLFDVDGTLINAHGLGRRALDRAFARHYGWEQATVGISFAGGTDPWIVSQVFAHRGKPAPGPTEVRTFLEVYAEQVVTEAQAPETRTEVLPGVPQLLSALAGLTGVGRQVVLTGNCSVGARVKLDLAGLSKHFACGAYGDEAVQREDLLPLALERAEATFGERFHAEHTVVIGDSLRDIDVAKAHGATSVCVATGWVSKAELVAAGADVVLDDLSDLQLSMRSLGALEVGA